MRVCWLLLRNLYGGSPLARGAFRPCNKGRCLVILFIRTHQHTGPPPPEHRRLGSREVDSPKANPQGEMSGSERVNFPRPAGPPASGIFEPESTTASGETRDSLALCEGGLVPAHEAVKYMRVKSCRLRRGLL